MRKVLLLSVVVLTAVCCVAVFNGDVDAESGSCGTGITYDLDSNGVLTISGNGQMADYSLQNPAPWKSSKMPIKSVVIESGVENIGAFAFANCSSLTDVMVGDDVGIIGASAFYGCGSLTNMFIGDKVITVADMAFYGCGFLKSISIPDSVETIGTEAFGRCGSLETVKIGSGVSSIREGAFSDCNNLKTIDVDPGNKNYSSEGNILYDSAKTKLIMYLDESDKTFIVPDTVSSIEGGAFSGCVVLTSVTIPDSVTGIGNKAFDSCRNLSKVLIGNGVVKIDANTFNDCVALTEISFGTGISSIDNDAFHGCSALDSIVIDSDNKVFKSDNGAILNKDGSELIKCPMGVTAYMVPNTVKIIGDYAFAECARLSDITIAKGVEIIGGFTFLDCSSLKAVNIPDSVLSVKVGAFQGCSSLAEVTIGENVASIDSMAFAGCTGIKKIYFGNGLESISSDALGVTLYDKDGKTVLEPKVENLRGQLFVETGGHLVKQDAFVNDDVDASKAAVPVIFAIVVSLVIVVIAYATFRIKH